LGWSTSGASRPQLISYLDDAIREHSIAVRDPITQGELLTFVYWPDGKPRAQKRCHDDTVIALALAWIVILRMPRPRPPDIERGARAVPRIAKYGGPYPEPDRRGTLVPVRGRRW
jgi:hypothetical protein